MAGVAEDEGAKPQDPEGSEGAKPQDPQGQQATGNDPEGGEGAKPQDPQQGESANRHQYDRDIERRDRKIAELETAASTRP